MQVAKVRSGNGVRIGVELETAYRPDTSRPESGGFRHRFRAKARAIVGGKLLRARADRDARRSATLSPGPARVVLSHHLFFTRAASRKILAAESAGTVRFKGTASYSLDRDQDGDADASASDGATTTGLDRPSAPALGAGISPCAQFSRDAACVDIPGTPNPATVKHLFDSEDVDTDCGSGLKVVRDGLREPQFSLTSVPTSADIKGATFTDANHVHVVDMDFKSATVAVTVIFACSPSGN